MGSGKQEPYCVPSMQTGGVLEDDFLVFHGHGQEPVEEAGDTLHRLRCNPSATPASSSLPICSRNTLPTAPDGSHAVSSQGSAWHWPAASMQSIYHGP